MAKPYCEKLKMYVLAKKKYVLQSVSRTWAS